MEVSGDVAEALRASVRYEAAYTLHQGVLFLGCG